MDVVQVLAAEIVDQVAASGEDPPTHVLVNAGVGGLASAVCASFWAKYGEARPLFICVEPLAAGCLLHSAEQVDWSIDYSSSSSS